MQAIFTIVVIILALAVNITIIQLYEAKNMAIVAELAITTAELAEISMAVNKTNHDVIEQADLFLALVVDMHDDKCREGDSITEIKNPALVRYAIRNNYKLLRCANQTRELIMLAIENDVRAAAFIDPVTEDNVDLFIKYNDVITLVYGVRGNYPRTGVISSHGKYVKYISHGTEIVHKNIFNIESVLGQIPCGKYYAFQVCVQIKGNEINNEHYNHCMQSHWYGGSWQSDKVTNFKINHGKYIIYGWCPSWYKN
jgi:hypothetical protein